MRCTRGISTFHVGRGRVVVLVGSCFSTRVLIGNFFSRWGPSVDMERTRLRNISLCVILQALKGCPEFGNFQKSGVVKARSE